MTSHSPFQIPFPYPSSATQPCVVSKHLGALSRWVFAVLLLAPLAVAQNYVTTKFPTFGGSLTFATAVNDAGQVVGESQLQNKSEHAFLWTRGAAMQDLGTLFGGSSEAMSINASGQVVGESDGRAFLWTPAGGLQNLGALGAYSSAYGINSGAEVVGSSQVTNVDIVHAFLWTTSAGMQDLGTLPGGASGSFAAGINDSGQVAGSSAISTSFFHAFLWTQANGMQDLGTLGGPNSYAAGINNSGAIVGTSDTADGFQHAFLWTQAGGMQDLGTLPGLIYSSAGGISNTGEIVGYGWGPAIPKGTPFLFTQTGGMKTLSSFGKARLTNGNAISDAGLILASLYNGSGYASYLLTPEMVTTLASFPNPSNAGEQVTLMATVGSVIAGPPPDGESVAFMHGTTVLGVSPLKNGAASVETSNIASGTQAIQAVYKGDPNYGLSRSSVLEQVVQGPKKTSTTLNSSLNPSVYWQNVTWTATVSTIVPEPLTGKVRFIWKGEIIGQASPNADGVATLTRADLNADTFQLIAEYLGDATNLGSTSPVLNQVVTEATTSATLASSANPSTAAQAVTFTAIVTSPTVTATGPVTFSAGGTVLGTVQLKGGRASFTTSALPAGSNTVTATYNGDSNIGQSAASVIETVQP